MSALSAATGKDASHNAGKAQQQSTDYQKQAAPLYSQLASQGSDLTQLFTSQFPTLLSVFEGAAGLPNTVGNQPQGTQGVVGGQAGVSVAHGATQGTIGGTAQGNGRAPTQRQPAGQQQPMQAMHPGLQQYAAANPTFNPWSLNPDAQAYLGSQIQALDQEAQSSIGTYQSQLANMGIQDSTSASAGATWIRQQNEARKNQLVSSFMLQQQQQQEAAAQSLLGTIAGIGQQGAQQTGQAAAGFAGLSGANQNAALQQEQLANSQQAGLGSFLGGFIPGGSFASALGNYGLNSGGSSTTNDYNFIT